MPKCRKSGCEKGIHLKPAHPDQCIKEEDDFEDDGDDGGEKAVQDEQQNDPSSSSSFAARYQSADLSSVTPRSSNPIDANDLKEENDSNADEDDDVDDPNEKKRRIKSDGNMDEEGGEVEDDNRNENEGGKNQKQMKKGRKDQFSNPVSRSSESVSCSPTNYDLMKEQIQAKCEYFFPFLSLTLNYSAFCSIHLICFLFHPFNCRYYCSAAVTACGNVVHSVVRSTADGCIVWSECTFKQCLS